MITFDVEYTDTFGGEANYSWVRRDSITVPEKASDRLIMMRARRAMGLTGCPGRTDTIGELLEFRPYGSCTVMFVTLRWEGAE